MQLIKSDDLCLAYSVFLYLYFTNDAFSMLEKKFIYFLSLFSVFHVSCTDVLHEKIVTYTGHSLLSYCMRSL